MIPFINPDLTIVEARAAHDVILGGFVNEGNLAKGFEEAIAAFVGSRYAVVTTSCTVALSLALMALEIKKKQIIVPDITMIGTAMAVVMSDNVPVVVDVLDNGCIDPNQIGRFVTSNTAAIIPVHVNGRNALTPELIHTASKYNLEIIEDAACCLGSKFDGKQVGTCGRVGCFSLAATKIIGCGQGGIVVTNDFDLYQKIVRLKDWGRFEEKGMLHPFVGFNFKFTDIQASIALVQLERLSQLVEKKKYIYNYYRERLKELMFVSKENDGFCPWYVDIKGKKNYVQILKERGVGSQMIWPPLHRQGAMTNFLRRGQNFPIASRLEEMILWLPSSTKLTESDMDLVCGQLGEIVDNNNIGTGSR